MPMESIKQILNHFNFDSPNELPEDDYIEIELEHYDPLIIEKVAENRISVSHTYTQNMDIMRNPEIVFDISGDDWVAVMHQDDPTNKYEDDESGLKAATTFAHNTWDDNLKDQGFVKAAETQEELN